MGSSLGGLISHYGSLEYQEIFSKAGLFSPSYWFSDSVWSFTQNTGKLAEMRFFQLCGTNESSNTAESEKMVNDMKGMKDSLVNIGFGQDVIFNKIVNGGQHNEKLWREAFGEAYLWLFDSFINSISEPTGMEEITCFPNPVVDLLIFHTYRKVTFDTVQISDMNGRQVKILKYFKDNKIDVHDLKPGIYIIKCTSGKDVCEGKFIKK
jgi:alpha-glucosidase